MNEPSDTVPVWLANEYVLPVKAFEINHPTLKAINEGRINVMTRAKFVCTAKDNGSAHFQAVTSGSEENKKFFTATPGGSIALYTIADHGFEVGKSYYVDFTPAAD